MVDKYRLECKGCGYTWYPQKHMWDKPGKEIDCPNQDCPYHGSGFRPLGSPVIWEIKETIKGDD